MVNPSRFASDPRIDKPWGSTLREKLPRSVRLRYVNWGCKECQQPCWISFCVFSRIWIRMVRGHPRSRAACMYFCQSSVMCIIINSYKLFSTSQLTRDWTVITCVNGWHKYRDFPSLSDAGEYRGQSRKRKISPSTKKRWNKIIF
jgi:hypothetical protein